MGYMFQFKQAIMKLIPRTLKEHYQNCSDLKYADFLHEACKEHSSEQLFFFKIRGRLRPPAFVFSIK